MEKKPWYLSKTIIGAAVLLVLTVLPSLGVSAEGLDANVITAKLLKLSEAIVELVGIGLVVYGRITATKKLSAGPGKDVAKLAEDAAGFDSYAPEALKAEECGEAVVLETPEGRIP